MELNTDELAEWVGRFAVSLLRASDPMEVAHLGVDHTARLLSAEMAYVSILPPEGRRLELIASIGVPSALLHQCGSVPVEAGYISSTVIRTGELQQVPKIDALPDYAEFKPIKDLAGVGMNSYFAAPLSGTSSHLGVLCLARSKEGRLSSTEQKLLGSVTTALALAFDRARAAQQEHKLSIQMRTIRDAILSIDIGTDPQSFIRELVSRACELTQARYGALGVLDKNGNGLSDFITVGILNEERRQIGELPKGRGLLEAVIRERKAVRVTNISDDYRSVGFPEHHPKMTTFLGIPLRLGRKIYGNFYLTEKTGGRPFTEEDERILELFGSQAALALEYALKAQEATKERMCQEATFKQLEILREEFAAVVSHDLKNPIQAILSQTELLGKHGANPEQTARNIARSAEKLAHLADELLDVARIEHEQIRVEPRELELARDLPPMIEAIAPSLGDHPLIVRIGAKTSKALLDPPLLDRILANLLSNAAKYSPPRSPIEVAVEESEDGIEIRVVDRGFGISKEEQGRLFDRFYQTKRARAKREGLGLGLYITQGLIKAQGGRIWVDSELGHGSTFHVWFPTFARPHAKAA